jgi:hypothetical protein
VRGEAALRRLPDAERAEWARLWGEAEVLLRRTYEVR